MKQQKQSIENFRYFFIGILLLIQINAFSLGRLPRQIVFNLHQQDTFKKNETICYEFKLINNSDTILNNIELTDYFISNAQCFHLSTNTTDNLQVSEQSFNPLTTNLSISHIPIGHSSFSLEIDVSSDLLSKSNFYKNQEATHLYFAYPKRQITTSNDGVEKPPVGNMLCITIEIDKFCSENIADVNNDLQGENSIKQ